MNSKLKKILGSEISYLPVYVRLMTITQKNEPKKEKIIKIEAHNTTKFKTYPFYKSISPCINLNNTKTDG